MSKPKKLAAWRKQRQQFEILKSLDTQMQLPWTLENLVPDRNHQSLMHLINQGNLDLLWAQVDHDQCQDPSLAQGLSLDLLQGPSQIPLQIDQDPSRPIVAVERQFDQARNQIKKLLSFLLDFDLLRKIRYINYSSLACENVSN